MGRDRRVGDTRGGGTHQHLDIGIILTDKLCQLKTIHHRHVDVEQHQIGLDGRKQFPSYTPILGITNFIALHL